MKQKTFNFIERVYFWPSNLGNIKKLPDAGVFETVEFKVFPLFFYAGMLSLLNFMITGNIRLILIVALMVNAFYWVLSPILKIYRK